MRSNGRKVIENLKRKFEKVKIEAPKILANEGVRVFLDNFKTESNEGDKWKEVQRRQPGTFAYKYPKKKDIGRRTRPILIGKTRKLKNHTVNSIRSYNTKRIRWSNSLPYAGVQNKTRTFMGAGPVFRKRLRTKFELMYRKL